MKGNEGGTNWNEWERKGMKGDEGECIGMKGNGGGMHRNERERRRMKVNEGGMNWNECK
jgi:hypothetical protein